MIPVRSVEAANLRALLGGVREPGFYFALRRLASNPMCQLGAMVRRQAEKRSIIQLPGTPVKRCASCGHVNPAMWDSCERCNSNQFLTGPAPVGFGDFNIIGGKMLELKGGFRA